nr:hypothetical protein [Cohaesibacter sp. ES.047]
MPIDTKRLWRCCKTLEKTPKSVLLKPVALRDGIYHRVNASDSKPHSRLSRKTSVLRLKCESTPSISILNVGGMNDDKLHQANGIGNDMPFAPLIFFPAS